MTGGMLATFSRLITSVDRTRTVTLDGLSPSATAVFAGSMPGARSTNVVGNPNGYRR